MRLVGRSNASTRLGIRERKFSAGHTSSALTSKYNTYVYIFGKLTLCGSGWLSALRSSRLGISLPSRPSRRGSSAEEGGHLSPRSGETDYTCTCAGVRACRVSFFARAKCATRKFFSRITPEGMKRAAGVAGGSYSSSLALFLLIRAVESFKRPVRGKSRPA